MSLPYTQENSYELMVGSNDSFTKDMDNGPAMIISDEVLGQFLVALMAKISL